MASIKHGGGGKCLQRFYEDRQGESVLGEGPHMLGDAILNALHYTPTPIQRERRSPKHRAVGRHE